MRPGSLANADGRTPIPPQPRWLEISYGPKRAPMASDIRFPLRSLFGGARTIDTHGLVGRHLPQAVVFHVDFHRVHPISRLVGRFHVHVTAQYGRLPVHPDLRLAFSER